MRLALSRCTVRPWVATDLDSLVSHANNRNVSRQLRDRFPFPYQRENGQAFLEWMGSQAVPTAWALDVDGQAVGGIGLELQTDVCRVSAEIGYWLGESLWGRGIVSEALQAVTAEAFQLFDLTRIFALPFVENQGSVRVLEKAGYTLEGRLRQCVIKDGNVHDQFLYAAYKSI